MEILDYYALLQVEPTATIGEIRRAYRRLAKTHHPDKNPGREEEARRRFEALTRAYKVLSDEWQRQLYDRRQRPRPSASGARPSRHDTQIDLAYRVLDLLLLERMGDALDHLDQLLAQSGKTVVTLDLTRYLDYGDARDGEFLLAEALERHGRTDEAIHLYSLALEREARRPYFRRFTEEILDRFKNLRLRRACALAEQEGFSAAVRAELDALGKVKATRQERAYTYRRLAEALENGNYRVAARELLEQALSLYPKLPGVKRLAERLGVAAFRSGSPPASLLTEV